MKIDTPHFDLVLNCRFGLSVGKATSDESLPACFDDNSAIQRGSGPRL
jgi:hypothetical protein